VLTMDQAVQVATVSVDYPVYHLDPLLPPFLLWVQVF